MTTEATTTNEVTETETGATENTAAPKKAAKKAAKKAPAAAGKKAPAPAAVKKAAKKLPAVDTSAAVASEGPTGIEVTLLEALSKTESIAKGELKKIGGTSKVLGAATKEGGGNQGGGMLLKGWVKAERVEGTEGVRAHLAYSVTAKGRKILEKAQKDAAKAAAEAK